ncbi:MAG: PQQ-binding-like beta-propeller repeat protein [Sandaracinaceae bacterium]|nr:PQQ-binding-like beta-propeller repeat protein [Sandaracinaceae bacterium]
MKRALTICALAFGLAACRERPEVPEWRELVQIPDRPMVISQRDLNTVDAIDPRDGSTIWSYYRPPLERTRWAVRPQPHVVCPITYLPVGRVVLRYHDAMHVLDVETGELLWEKAWILQRFCPVASLDSGVLTITELGTQLEKLDANGNEVWVYDFSQLGEAIAQPTVIWPTGDVLVRTRHRILAVSPTGDLNWSELHSVEGAPP